MEIVLLPPEIEILIPPLYSGEEIPLKDKLVVAKFFSPYSNWTWLVTEGNREGDDYIFFGLVYGLEKEWGYFALSELEGAKRGDLPLVERDLYFETMKKVSELEKIYDELYR